MQRKPLLIVPINQSAAQGDTHINNTRLSKRS